MSHLSASFSSTHANFFWRLTRILLETPFYLVRAGSTHLKKYARQIGFIFPNFRAGNTKPPFGSGQPSTFTTVHIKISGWYIISTVLGAPGRWRTHPFERKHSLATMSHGNEKWMGTSGINLCICKYVCVYIYMYICIYIHLIFETKDVCTIMTKLCSYIYIIMIYNVKIIPIIYTYKISRPHC